MKEEKKCVTKVLLWTVSQLEEQEATSNTRQIQLYPLLKIWEVEMRKLFRTCIDTE